MLQSSSWFRPSVRCEFARTRRCRPRYWWVWARARLVVSSHVRADGRAAVHPVAAGVPAGRPLASAPNVILLARRATCRSCAERSCCRDHFLDDLPVGPRMNGDRRPSSDGPPSTTTVSCWTIARSLCDGASLRNERCTLSSWVVVDEFPDYSARRVVVGWTPPPETRKPPRARPQCRSSTPATSRPPHRYGSITQRGLVVFAGRASAGMSTTPMLWLTHKYSVNNRRSIF